MSSIPAGIFFLVAVIVSGPAVACTGPGVIFEDNFQSANPAWDSGPSAIPITPAVPILSIASGQAKLTPPPGSFALAVYDAQFFPDDRNPNFDACVDISGPQVADASQAAAGIVFGQSAAGFYVFAMEEDGQAAVAQFQQQPFGWSYPVPWRPAASLKTGANASNTLRVTLSPNGTPGKAAVSYSAVVYINGSEFAALTLPSFQGGKLGLWDEGDPGANPVTGATWSFSNLRVTNAAAQ